MNNVNGWLIAWGLAMSAVAIATSLVAWLKYKSERTITKQLKQTRLRLDALTGAHQTTKDQRDRLNEENEELHKAIGAQAKQNLDLHKKNTELHSQLADRNEALQEARAAIENLQTDLHMAKGDMQEAVKSDMPLTYAEAKPAIDKAAQSTKRPTRGKKAGQP